MSSQLDILLNRPERLSALQRLMVLDTPTDPTFDRLTKLAAKIIRVPVAIVTFIDQDREFIKSQFGLPEPVATSRVLPLSASICKHIIPTGEPLVIDDARRNPLSADNLAVTEMGAAAFVGVPLIAASGYVVGSFCVVDSNPRVWQQDEVDVLEELAASVMTEIALLTELNVRKQAEVEMRNAQNKYEALFERSLDAVFIYDFQEHFVELNQAALTLIGYTKADIPQLTIARLVAPDQVERAFALVEEIRLNGFQQQPVEFHVKTADSADRYVDVRCSLIYRDGEPWAIQAIAHDVTTRKRTQDVLQEALVKEKDLNDFKSRVFSLISHEFRNPLAAILSAETLLQRYGSKISEERKQDCMAQIERRVNQLIDLTDDLLILGKAESPDVAPNRIEINPVEFCHAVIRDIQKTSVEAVIEFTVTGECESLFLDVKVMRQALTNLLSNAIKYSPTGSPILLTLLCLPDQIEISVQDHGIGIPEADIGHLFDEFHRAANVGNISGTGLGLAIVKRAVESHGGTVTVESEVGKGTTFVIWLPRLEEAKSA